MILPKGWLTARLSPIKRTSPLWVALADSLQLAFEQTLGKSLNTLTENRSLLTMSPPEINQLQRGMGHFFSLLDVSDDANKGLTLMHRQNHIHLKNTAYPITDMVRRQFDGLAMQWLPRYAPIDQDEHPYGTRFISELAYHLLPADQQTHWFLTSRGTITLNLNQYMPSIDEMDRIYSTIRATIIPMIPLDIVFDGFYAQVLIPLTLHLVNTTTVTAPVADTAQRTVTTTTTHQPLTSLSSHFMVSHHDYAIDVPTGQHRQPLPEHTHPRADQLRADHYPTDAPYHIGQYLASLSRPVSLQFARDIYVNAPLHITVSAPHQDYAVDVPTGQQRQPLPRYTHPRADQLRADHYPTDADYDLTGASNN